MILLLTEGQQKQKSATFVKNFIHKSTIDKNYCKVRGHRHFTGKYRHIAQSI